MQGDPFGLHAGLLGEVLVIEQIALVLLLPVRLGAVCLFELYPIGILHVGERGAFIRSRIEWWEDWLRGAFRGSARA